MRREQENSGTPLAILFLAGLGFSYLVRIIVEIVIRSD